MRAYPQHSWVQSQSRPDRGPDSTLGRRVGVALARSTRFGVIAFLPGPLFGLAPLRAIGAHPVFRHFAAAAPAGTRVEPAELAQRSRDLTRLVHRMSVPHGVILDFLHSLGVTALKSTAFRIIGRRGHRGHETANGRGQQEQQLPHRLTSAIEFRSSMTMKHRIPRSGSQKKNPFSTLAGIIPPPSRRTNAGRSALVCRPLPAGGQCLTSQQSC